MKYLALSLFVLPFLAAPAPVMADPEITIATCEADRDAQYAEAERNRAQAIEQLEAQLRFTSDDQVAAELAQGIDAAWEQEEQFRNYASINFRDCTRYVKSLAQ